jgi:hypothetical protein
MQRKKQGDVCHLFFSGGGDRNSADRFRSTCILKVLFIAGTAVGPAFLLNGERIG